MKKLAIVALLSALVAAPVVAADMGFYAGVHAGSAQIDFPILQSTTSVGLVGGYTINQNFAVEAAYTDFGSQTYSGLTLKSSGFSISGVGSLPINEQFSLMAKLGLASTTLDDAGFSTNKTDLTYGVGAQFNATKQIGIRLGYDVYKVSDVIINLDQKVTSVGAVFAF